MRRFIYTIILFTFLWSSKEAFSATYYSRANGNWNDGNTWSTVGFNGAAAGAFPIAGDVVNIRGRVITVNVASACASIAMDIDNSAGNADAQLYVNNVTLTLTGDLDVTSDNFGYHNDVLVDGNGILNIGGSLNLTRVAGNNQDERLRVLVQDDGQLNVTGDIVFDYHESRDNGGSREYASDVVIEDRGAIAADNVTLSINEGQALSILMRDTSTFDVTTDLTLNHNNGDSAYINMYNGSTLTIGGDLNVNQGASSPDNDLALSFYNTSTLDLSGDLNFNHNGDNESMNMILNNSSDINIGGALNFNHIGGDNMELEVNDAATLDVTNNLVMDLNTSTDRDVLTMDLNGGTVTVLDTLKLLVGPGCTNRESNRIYMDGANLNADDLYVLQEGGGGGDIDIFLNFFSTATACTLNVANDFVMNHEEGDEMELEINANGHVDVGDEHLVNMNVSADNDAYYLDINEGTMDVVGNSRFTVDPLCTSQEHILFYMDGGRYTTDDLVFDHNGGGNGDVLLLVNRDQTAVASTLTVGGELQFNHTAGDNMELEINDNVTATVADDLMANLTTSADRDLITIDLNGGSLTVTDTVALNVGAGCNNREHMQLYVDDASLIAGDLIVSQAGGGNGDVSLFVNLDSNGVSSVLVNRNLVIDHDGGDNAEIQINSGGTFRVMGDCDLDLASADGDDIFIDINGTGQMTVDTDLNLVNNGAGTGEIFDVRVDDTGILQVDTDVNFTLNGGGNSIVYLNSESGTGAQLNIARDLNVSNGASAGNFTIQVNQNGELDIDRNATLTNDGIGGNNVVLQTNESGAIAVAGNLTATLNSAGVGSNDDMRIDMNDDGTLTADSLIMVSSGAGGDDLQLLMDSSSTVTVGDFVITHAGGDDVVINLNGTAGTDATLNVTRDFIINHNAGDDVLLRMNELSTLSVTDDMEFHLLVSADGDNMTFDLNDTANATIGGSFTQHLAAGNNVQTTIDDGAQLSVTGSLIFDQDGGVNNRIRVNEDNGTDATLIISGDLTFDYAAGTIAELELNQNAIATIGGDVNLNAASAGVTFIDMNHSSRLNIAGDFVRPSGFGRLSANAGGQVVNYNGTAAGQTFAVTANENFYYQDVYFNNTHADGVTLGADLNTTDVSGDVRTQSGLVQTGGFTTTMNGGATWEVANGATWRTTTAGATGGVATGGTQLLGATSTIEFAGGNQTVPVLQGGVDYGNLHINGTLTKTLAGDESIVTNLIMEASTFDVGTNTLDGAGGILASGGDLQISKLTGTVPELTGGYVMTGGTVTLNGAGDQSLYAKNYYNVLIAGNGVKTLSGITNVDGDFTLQDADDTLDVSTSNYDFYVGGDWTNNGHFAHQEGTLYFDGTVAQSIAGDNHFYNVDVNNAAGVSIASGSDTLLASLSLTSGNFETNDTLVLKSTSSMTARIAEITGGTISGDITMQRLVDNGATNWRFFSSAVSGRTFEDWDDDAVTTGITGSDYPTWPNVLDPWESIWTYNEATAGAFDNGYEAVADMSDPIATGEGYWWWSGDSLGGTDSFMVDVKGPANTGVIALPVTYTNSASADDGWNLVGNPYPSAIDWDDAGWTKTNIDDAIYIWDPETETYASWVAGVGTNGGSAYIPSSQAFWVKANAAGPALTVNEGVKYDSLTVGFKSNNRSMVNHLARFTIRGNGYQDESVLRIMPGAEEGFDNHLDAYKVFGTNYEVPTISIMGGKDELAISSIPEINEETVIPLRVLAGVTGSYELNFADDGISSSISCLVLEDLLTGALIDLNQNPTYTFKLVDTTDVPRFLLRLGAPVASSVLAPSCNVQNDGQIVVSPSGSGPWDYEWRDEKGNILRSTLASTQPDTLDQLSPGMYSVTVEGASFCGAEELRFELQSTQTVLASFATDKDTMLISGKDEIAFYNLSVGSQYSWDFGDGSFSNELNPTHAYASAGRYEVELTVTSGNCVSTSQRNVYAYDQVTSTNEIFVAQDLQINLFPNPVQKHASFELQLNRGTNYDDLQVEIKDMMGRTVVYKNVPSGVVSLAFEAGEIGSGSYVLTLWSDNELVASEKLIVE